MNKKNRIFLTFVGTLVAAAISQISLSSSWHDLATQGRVFSSIILLNTISSVPISWPFVFGGALIAGLEMKRNDAVLFTLSLGGLGSVLYFFLAPISWTLAPTWSYSIYLIPLFAALIGYLAIFGVHRLRATEPGAVGNEGHHGAN